MAKKLFIGSLSWNTTDESLGAFFSQVGEVLSANVAKDKISGRSRGFGFVEFANDADADKAKAELNGQELDGRAINIDDAQEKPRTENRGPRNFDNRGGNGGGGGFNRGGGRGGRY